jgi:DMSO/TMAO reductase YedYZ molybdopterin-dependent catalytic subunit
MKRRLFVASSLSAVTLAGCAAGNALTQNQTVHKILSSVDVLNHGLIGTRGMAKEYTDADVDRHFRTNGFDTPSSSRYIGYVKDRFASYRLVVDGLVDRKQVFTVAELRAMPLQTQITRHDCVEGWSAIGKWRGVQLAHVLAMAQPQAGARYVIFHCMDVDDQGTPYYESLDMHEAAHPQTILSLDLNDAPLDADHGAPVRLRVPTQLGYKSAKWVDRIELASTFSHVFSGKGGYWEDSGYNWYAGI